MDFPLASFSEKKSLWTGAWEKMLNASSEIVGVREKGGI